MQPDGGQRSHKNFMVERQEMLWDVGVRVHVAMGGIAMERKGSLPSFPGEIEAMGAMCGGDADLKAMPLVDSALGAGWVVGQLGVAGFAAGVQNGRGGVERGEHEDWRGPRVISGGFCERGPQLLLSSSKWRCPGCAAINPVEFGECDVCCYGVEGE